MSISERLHRYFASPSDTVAAAWLFGSHAEDRAHRESDVDVGVLFGRDALPTVKERFEEGIRLAGILAGTIGHSRVDLVVLNDAPTGLAANIVTRGRPLCIVDGPAEHAFRRDVQLRAADLEPFLRRTRAIKLQALGR